MTRDPLFGKSVRSAMQPIAIVAICFANACSTTPKQRVYVDDYRDLHPYVLKANREGEGVVAIEHDTAGQTGQGLSSP